VKAKGEHLIAGLNGVMARLPEKIVEVRGKGLIRDRMHMQFPGGLPDDGTPGMALMKELWDRYGTVTSFDASYWEGVVIAMIMERAFEKAHKKFGKVDSETINKALETFKDESFGGLFPNVSYTPTDHSGSWKARIVKINENRTYTPLTGFWAPVRESVKVLKP